MRGAALLGALALAACAPAGAPSEGAGTGAGATWSAFNTMRVVSDPARPATASVISRAQAGPSDFWCAAGDWAIRRRGVAPAGRVYLLRGRGPSPVSYGRSAATFTTDPPAELAGGPVPGQGGRHALRLDEPGFNLRAAQARGYCPDSLRKFGFGPRL